MVTVTTVDAGKTYGDTTTGSASLSGSLDTAATATSGVGTYAITRGSLAASPNDAVAFVPGVLTIVPGKPTVVPAAPGAGPLIASTLAKDQSLAETAVPLVTSLQSDAGNDGTAVGVGLVASRQFNSVFVCVQRPRYAPRSPEPARPASFVRVVRRTHNVRSDK